MGRRRGRAASIPDNVRPTDPAAIGPGAGGSPAERRIPAGPAGH